MAKIWKNGGTKETIYSCSNFSEKTGYLNPKESCQCLGAFSGEYTVVYCHSGHKKIGFVKYHSGVE